MANAHRRFLIVLVGSVLLATALPLAQSTPPSPMTDGITLEELLARPLSPGVVALLLPHAANSDVQQRWRTAALDPSPTLRAAAARAIYAGGLKHLLPVVRQALDKESDQQAALEQARALVALGDAPAVQAAIAAAGRLRGGVEPAMTAAEKKALAKVLDLEDWPPRALPGAARVSAAERETQATQPLVRTPVAYPQRFVFDTLAVAGCADSVLDRAAAEITYRPDGRPRRVNLIGEPASPACDQAVIALMMASIAPTDHPLRVERPHLVLMTLTPESEACREPDMPRDAAPGVHRLDSSAAGSIQPPKKIHTVPPVYPPAMQAERIQGLVLIEARISATGCVASAAVARSVHPELALAALAAVTRWRFTPTMLGGSPVPVIMTVTVNFALQWR